MSLNPQDRLGPYEILSPLGAGGMGVVYKARDTRLGREVAIKVLPESLSGRADVRERFVREARAISSLSHPHICPLYDVGSQDGIDYLVMEYLEGETLAHRLKKGPLPLDQTLRFGIEIASALDAAHRKGITHRDLKPGNVMLTKSGTKLLDFGLARMHTRGAAGDSAVATETEPMTAEGTIVGTLQYMAPEQLEGKDADARTDIFAFGATLYEMATGRKAFGGQSSASLIAAIMHNEPAPIDAAVPMTSPLLDRTVRKCLTKDPEHRWQSAADLADELRWIAEAGAQLRLSVPAAPKRQWLARVGVVLVAAFSGAGIATWLFPSKPTATPTLRYLTSSGHDSSPAASPNGKTVAFSSDRDGRRRIWIKELARGGEVPITEGPDDLPRFSPDGSTLLFLRGTFPNASLYRVASVGGDTRKLAEGGNLGGADWSPDGHQIAFVRQTASAGKVASAVVVTGADGGLEREIARRDDVGLFVPRWSPDGRTIAARQVLLGGASQSVFLASVDGKHTRVLTPPPGGVISTVAWNNGEEVIYSQNETVSPGGGSARFIRQNITSGAVETIFRSPHPGGTLDILDADSIILDTFSTRQTMQEIPLQGKGAEHQSRWLTRGNSQDRQPAYSPDGKWIIFSSDRSGNLDLWKISTTTGVVQRITDDPADDWDPAFTPDGNHIIWSSRRSGNLEIWMAAADGSGARQVTRDGVDAENPTATRDGTWIVYVSGNPVKYGLWKIHPDGSEATRLIDNRVIFPDVSPDGQYAAYNLDTLRMVRIADGAAVPFVTVNAGKSRWMPDGRALVFQTIQGPSALFIQDFVPGKDTTATRRRLTDPDPEKFPESFGISPDGSRMTVAYREQVFSLMIAEHVPGIRPRRVK